MARLGRVDLADPAARALYEKIIEGPRGTTMLDASGGLIGPFNAMLLSPPVGDALQELGAAIRYRSGLSDRARELAILVVADHWDSEFERWAHEPIARSLGLGDGPLSPEEETVVRIARALVNRQDLDEQEYASLPASVLFELTTLVGYYSTLALQLRVFRVTAPPSD